MEHAARLPRIPRALRTALGLTPAGPHYFFYRHRIWVRIAHWINALCLAILLMSGLNIFNAHPALYWGNNSNFEHPLVSLTATTDDGGNVVHGWTWIGDHSFDTTGWLGASVQDGQLAARGFPDWATLPGPQWLAMARQWHFAFAWLLVINGTLFVLYAIWTGHARRDLAPKGRDITHLPREIIDHVRLKFHHGEAARHYNGLQTLAYFSVIFILGPLIVATGLTMSPTMDAAFPGATLDLRRPAGGAHHPFHLRLFIPGFFHRPYRHGGAVGHLEQSALHDHRLVCHQKERAMSSDRRNFIGRALAGASTLLLSGCYDLSQKPWFTGLLGKVEDVSRVAQHLFAGPHTQAPEYSKADIAPVFRANGTLDPGTDDYHAHVQSNFTGWRVTVGGLVEHPLSLSMDAIRALPARTQITRHDCVEGWSCIGEWTGAPLALVMAAATPKPQARYVIFYCADPMTVEGDPGHNYYESLELSEAMHPQTILAYRMNGAALPIEHGAPVRLRAERQLGYKQPKYVQRIELVADFSRIGSGKGGYWEDLGYTWYGGI